MTNRSRNARLWLAGCLALNNAQAHILTNRETKTTYCIVKVDFFSDQSVKSRCIMYREHTILIFLSIALNLHLCQNKISCPGLQHPYAYTHRPHPLLTLHLPTPNGWHGFCYRSKNLFGLQNVKKIWFCKAGENIDIRGMFSRRWSEVGVADGNTRGVVDATSRAHFLFFFNLIIFFINFYFLLFAFLFLMKVVHWLCP